VARLTGDAVVRGVAQAVIQASSVCRSDLLKAYEEARKREDDGVAAWVCSMLSDNAAAAEAHTCALCDDTGTPHVFVELGDNCALPAGWMQWILEGVRVGMATLPTRPMAVRGTEEQRIGQACGLYAEPERLAPGAFLVDSVCGSQLRVTVLMLGGGPELRAKTLRVFHQRSLETVLEEVAAWGAEMLPKLGCTPATLAVGIGRSHFEASSLVLRAMKEGTLSEQSRWERLLTDKMNALGVGPLGVGGRTTVFGAFIRIGLQRASGFRLVSVRPCCCVEPRRATAEFPC
jgi:fumarate hydratase subunit alpha